MARYPSVHGARKGDLVVVCDRESDYFGVIGRLGPALANYETIEVSFNRTHARFHPSYLCPVRPGDRLDMTS